MNPLLLLSSTVILSCFLCDLSVAAIYVRKEEPFYSQAKRAIIRLEHPVIVPQKGSDQKKENLIPDGTGFFILYKDNLYVITARHVAEKGYDLSARVPVLFNAGRANEKEEIVTMKLPKESWVYHPYNGDEKNRFVDLAIMKISLLEGGNLKHFSYYQKNDIKFRQNQLPAINPEPPSDIMVFGFPMDIGFQLKEQRPFGRKGIISFVADEEFIKDSEGKYFDKECFIMDVEAFPGNSGSPVINAPVFTNKIELLGLVIASNDKQNFSIAEPVLRLRELLEYASRDKRSAIDVWHAAP